MRLVDLFEDGDTDQMSVTDKLRQDALDVLTPLMAHQIPFVTVQTVADELRSTRPGIVVDRALIMKLLDPAEVRAVSKIEGDRIYLSGGDESDQTETDQETKDDNIDKVKQNAIAQAKKQTSEPKLG